MPDAPVMNVLTNGTIIDADKLNENFDALNAGIIPLLLNTLALATSYGASAEATSEVNTSAIKAMFAEHKAIYVPENVPWAGTVDTTAETSNVLIIDAYNKQIVIGGQRFRYPENNAKSYIALQPFVKGNCDVGIWSFPSGEVTQTSGAAPRPAGNFKAFQDDYGKVAANPDEWGNVNYRDIGMVAYILEGAQGLGTSHINTKSNGEFTPFVPELCFTLMGSTHMPIRLYRLQPIAARAGNFFADRTYHFDYNMPIWKSGKNVVQGQLINANGKIYEAQDTGVTGNVHPIHATYRKKTLTLSGIVGAFQVGETIKENPGTAGFANGILESVVGADYLIRRWNQANWTIGATVTGQTSGATGVIDAVADTDVRVDNNANDYQPDGPAVTGLIVSDGAINWMFLDNITGYIAGNAGMQGIVILGDDPDLLPFPGFSDCGTHLVQGMLVYNGVPIRFLNAAGDSANMQMYRDTTNKLLIKAGSQANAEVRIFGGSDSAAYLRVLSNQVTASGMPFVLPSAVKANGAVTQDVSTANRITFNDSAPTNFTGFTGMVAGQPIYVRASTGNTTLKHSATLQLVGGADIVLAAERQIMFMAHTGTIATMVG